MQYSSLNTTIDKQVKQAVLRHVPDVEVIYLYGSYNTKYQTDSSDVDVAIYCKKPLENVAIWKYRTSLAKTLQVNAVDVVDLQTAGIVLQHQVVTTGRRLWELDFTKAELFENKILMLYLTFQQDYKALWADIKERGRVYG